MKLYYGSIKAALHQVEHVMPLKLNSSKALLRPYEGSVKALSRLVEHVRPLTKTLTKHLYQQAMRIVTALHESIALLEKERCLGRMCPPL